MKIYISGICGTGMGSLALMAKDAGAEVVGSDLNKGAILDELLDAGVEIEIGEQDGEFLRKSGADWFVYTSALPEDAPELVAAREMGVRISKRDELIAELVETLDLKMIAVAGTHGKTTTAGMMIWACEKLGIPAAYLIGTTLGFAPSGRYRKGDKYFIYEADEYDRNFLRFHPWLGVVTTATYDHADTYKTPEEYQAAFRQFEGQSRFVIFGGETDERANLSGALRREDATTAERAVFLTMQNMALEELASDKDLSIEKMDEIVSKVDEGRIFEILNEFPGVGRRFEKLSNGVYSDYGHHPEEIAATVEMALEEARRSDFKGVVAVYEPHQNIRQHQVREGYQDAFQGVSRLFWLPTYLVREDPSLAVLTPEELISGLTNSEVAEAAETDDDLAAKLRELRDEGYLVLLMTAGPADEWLRNVI